jgi:hypothetical protein
MAGKGLNGQTKYLNNMEDILNDFEENPPKMTFFDEINFIVMFPALLMILVFLYMRNKIRKNIRS